MSERFHPYQRFARSAKSAFFVPYPKDLRPIVAEKPEKYNQYEAHPDDIFGELVEVLENTETDKDIHFSNIRRADIASVVVNFTDLSRIPLDHEIKKSAQRAAKLISLLEEEHRQKGQKIGLARQFQLSLLNSQGNIPFSLLDLTLATRQAARNCDNHIFEGAKVDKNLYRFTKERMRRWKEVPKGISFPDGNHPNNDAVGSVYHLWGSSTAGYARENYSPKKGQFHPLDTAKSTISDLMYSNQGPLTKIRYRLTGDPGETHEPADTIGYEFGRAIFFYLSEK